ncbi:hypothetical protein PIB30_058951 [Stylosanthes scabra]|uniref:Uncharacterized protein n=1 Tax=Stylosanthes scabra TaxID=79078 RepID=A0ABU6QJJ8_9FABA|nr:hypothetical protein [Stylosanthes scabra]
MGEEGVAAPRRARRMPEGGGRRGSRGGGRSGGRASFSQGQHGASTSRAHQTGPGHAGPSHAGSSQEAGPSHAGSSQAGPSQAGLSHCSTPVLGSPSHDFLQGLNSLGFQRQLHQIFTADTVYIPEFDRRTSMSQMDLNEPASAPSQLFMAHAGTPPSAYMPDPYVIVSEPTPPPPPQDRTVADPDADDEGVPRGRGRRVIRRRDCGFERIQKS